MRKTKVVEVNEKTVTVKEMSVAEVKGLLDDSGEAKQEISIIDLMFGDEITTNAVLLCTDLTTEQLERDFMPSDIRLIIDTIKELNPFFFSMMQRLVVAAKSLQESRSTATPAP